MTLFTTDTCLRLLEDRSVSLELLEAELDRTDIPVVDKKRVLKNKGLASAKLLQYFKSRPKTPAKRSSPPLSDKVDLLSRSIDEIKESMKELSESVRAVKTDTAAIARPPSTPPLTSADQLAGPTNTGTVHPPFMISDGAQINRSAQKIHEQLEGDYTNFDNRMVAHFGVDYKYGKTHHPARNLNEAPSEVQLAIDDVREHFPDVDFNSVTVTTYLNSRSHIPFHQDLERQINPGSVVLGLSLGASRVLTFRTLLSAGKVQIMEHECSHGSVYSMDQLARERYEHGILPLDQDSTPFPIRVSVTFRSLTPYAELPPPSPPKSVRKPSVPHVSASKSTALDTPSTQTLLILSDSRNRSVDLSSFPKSAVIYRRDCFYIRDLDGYGEEIANADIVILSVGINDLRFGKRNPWQLHCLLRDLSESYPNTVFLFDAIMGLSAHAGNRNLNVFNINSKCEQLNLNMMHYSLRSENFRLFDNIRFGPPHLSRDGVHMTPEGRRLMTECWIEAVKIQMGLSRARSFPLRREFADLVCWYRNG